MGYDQGKARDITVLGGKYRDYLSNQLYGEGVGDQTNIQKKMALAQMLRQTRNAQSGMPGQNRALEAGASAQMMEALPQYAGAVGQSATQEAVGANSRMVDYLNFNNQLKTQELIAKMLQEQRERESRNQLIGNILGGVASAGLLFL